MTDFPFEYEVFIKMLEIFKSFRGELLKFFPLIFLLRVVLAFVCFKQEGGFLEILKDSLILWGLFYFFSDFVVLAMKIPYFFTSLFEGSEVFEIPLQGEGFIGAFVYRLTRWFAVISYWISFGIYVFIISLLILLSAFLIFLSSSLSSYTSLKMYVGVFVLTSLWPVFWYGVNFALVHILLTENPFANNILLMLGSLLKIFFPLLFFSFVSKFSSGVALKIVSLGGAALSLASFFEKKRVQTLNATGQSRHTHRVSNSFKRMKRNLKFKSSQFRGGFKQDLTKQYNASYHQSFKSSQRQLPYKPDFQKNPHELMMKETRSFEGLKESSFQNSQKRAYEKNFERASNKENLEAHKQIEIKSNQSKNLKNERR